MATLDTLPSALADLERAPQSVSVHVLEESRKSFFDYYAGAILRPRDTFFALTAESRRLRYGFFAILVSAFLYTLVYVFLTLGGGAPSSFEPWLAISKEAYYSYNRFLLAPSMIGAWMLASAVVQLAARVAGSRGHYEETLAVLGFAISVPCLASLVHDLPDTFLGAIGVLDLRAYEVTLNSPTIWRAVLWTLYILSVLWFLVLFPKAVRAVHGIGRWTALVIGWSGYAVYQFVFLIFNR